MRTQIPILAISLSVLAACASQPPSQPTPDFFELRNASDGKTYRIDRRSGRTAVLEGGIFKEVPEPSMPQLVVGKVYRSEDGKATYKYNGEGRLERWGLDRIFGPETPSSK